MTRSNAFTQCPTCGGAGFLRSGDFGAERRFTACPDCGGCGQAYLDPMPERDPAKEPQPMVEF